MPSTLTPLVNRLRRLAKPSEAAGDAEFLARYVRDRDEAAFAALVARHGPLVWNVCRRVLGDAHAADEAAQATFLVLARRAGALGRPAALAGWLYGVAWRVARKARRAGRRRRGPRAPAAAADRPDPRPDPLGELTARELVAVLEEEVRRLPEAQRLAVVLCCLEGLSQEEAARRLGCTPGSVKGRLERGRARLDARLVRRGLALTAALAAAEAVRGSGAAARLAVGPIVSVGSAPASVAGLAEGVLKVLFLTKLTRAAAWLLVLGAAACTAGLVCHGVAGVRSETAGPEARPAARDGGAAGPGKAGAPQIHGPAPGQRPRVEWLDERGDLPASGLKVELSPGARVLRARGALVLPATITNHAPKDVTAVLAHEWHGGEWPPTGLYASVCPDRGPAAAPFRPVYLVGERNAAGKTVIPAGKSVEVELRMDWPGTGSQPAVPFLEASARGRYRVRLLLVFEAGGTRQFAAGAEKVVEVQGR
jgi:RNA polymerase sigma factor (sigma-70 family)